MMKRNRQITLHISSLDDCTQVKTRAEGTLGNIYYLESDKCSNFFYYIQLPNSGWIDKEFETEMNENILCYNYEKYYKDFNINESEENKREIISFIKQSIFTQL